MSVPSERSGANPATHRTPCDFAVVAAVVRNRYSMRGPAAVHGQRRTSHRTAAVAAQEQGQSRQFAHFDEAFV
ncbi:MAG: hypothetical protein QOJ15_8893, partial [Bradyrhizobium sp.]|nr:hypothetical protein [Bradyrhizobium sp.]